MLGAGFIKFHQLFQKLLVIEGGRVGHSNSAFFSVKLCVMINFNLQHKYHGVVGRVAHAKSSDPATPPPPKKKLKCAPTSWKLGNYVSSLIRCYLEHSLKNVHNFPIIAFNSMQFGKSVESRLKLKVRKFDKSHFWDCGDVSKS